MKQCGRSWLPAIQPLQRLTSLVDNSSHYHLKFILHEKTDALQKIAWDMKSHEEVRSILFVVGPEGGFSDEEITSAGQAGFRSVSLGTRRLRAETAAVVAVSQALA